MNVGKEGAIFIGFTGTPLLRKDRETTREVFGTYIHTYKFLEGEGEKDSALEIYEKGVLVAQQKRNFHALNELKNAMLMANGLLDEDD